MCHFLGTRTIICLSPLVDIVPFVISALGAVLNTQIHDASNPSAFLAELLLPKSFRFTYHLLQPPAAEPRPNQRTLGHKLIQPLLKVPRTRVMSICVSLARRKNDHMPLSLVDIVAFVLPALAVAQNQTAICQTPASDFVKIHL